MKHKILGIIPARLNSTRLPGKLLLDVCGKPLIQWTYENAKKASSFDELIIATDSEKIAETARSFGARVIMTSDAHPTGSDRISEAVTKFDDFVPDIVVNVQGDEPLISLEAIEGLCSLLDNDEALHVGGVAARTTSEDEVTPSSVVKLLVDKDDNVLSFSRSVVPFLHNRHNADKRVFHKILGLTAFRREFLLQYVRLPQLPLEQVESIEQMRILEHGYRMRVVVGDFQEVGVNTPEELEQVREIIKQKIHG